jgi:hypothetical protein
VAKIRTFGAHSKAQAVLAIAHTLMDDDLPESQDIYVCGRNPGLTLQLWDGSRKCNVYGHGNSDSIMVVVGEREDFEYPSGDPKESAEVFPFSYRNYYDAAVLVVDWLCKGERTYEEAMA